MLQFKAYVNVQQSAEDPLVTLLMKVKEAFTDAEFKVHVMDLNNATVKKEARKLKLPLEEPTLLINNTRITGQVNEYFILATVEQLLAKGGNSQTLTEFVLKDRTRFLKVKAISEFLYYQIHMREDTTSFLMLIRENCAEIDVEKIKKTAEKNFQLYILSNFTKGKNVKKVSALGKLNNVYLGHINRENIHMTMCITIRKSRPFFGSFLRVKHTNGYTKGIWSPLLNDSINQLKTFFIPLFQVASPVHLDGKIPYPPETNRVIAKVKENIESLKKFYN